MAFDATWDYRNHNKKEKIAITISRDTYLRIYRTPSLFLSLSAAASLCMY